MGSRTLLVAALAILIAACQRDESRPAPGPSAPPKATPAAQPAQASAASTAPAASPPKAAESGDEADNDSSANDNEDIDKPWGTEFEIDADANRYFGYPPMLVMFAAKPLNGKPPFTYTWDFGDGGSHVTGEVVNHVYDKIGRYTAFVEGKDGNGETYRVSFIIAVVSAQDFASRKGLDVSTLPSLSPVPTTTP
jgi:hypothetical protein